MKYLFDSWSQIQSELSGKEIFLFLDYDGTLTPIVAQPEAARINLRVKTLLAELAGRKEICTAIVSGRSLGELKKMVGVRGLIYVGNHGFEIEGPGINHIHPGALEAKGLIQDISDLLEVVFNPSQKVRIENKTFTLSVHYRQVPAHQVQRVKMAFFKALYPFLESAKVIFTEGKKVLEVRPALGWNKGSAVIWLHGRRQALYPSRTIVPIYAGDDQTDESALKAIKAFGLGVKVGEESLVSHASYYLRDPAEIYLFLKRLQSLKGENRER